MTAYAITEERWTRQETEAPADATDLLDSFERGVPVTRTYTKYVLRRDGEQLGTYRTREDAERDAQRAFGARPEEITFVTHERRTP